MNVLKNILAERNLTLKKASEITGVNMDNLVRLVYKEADFMTIKLDTLVKLCIGLNIKAVDLFEGEQKEKVMRLTRKGRAKKWH